jgi:presenilin-like A22 family membrane protease
MLGEFGAGPALKNERLGEAAGDVHSYWSKLLGMAALTVVTVEFENTKKAEEIISKVKATVVTFRLFCIFLFLLSIHHTHNNVHTSNYLCVA